MADGLHVLRNARLPGERFVDVHIADGSISAVVDGGAPLPAGATADDLDGWLLLTALAEPHAHLDKALTSERVPNPNGDLLGAIEAWLEAAEAGMFTHDDIVARAIQAMELLLVHGVTAVRTHVNVYEQIGARSIVAMIEARDRMAGLIDVEIVALTGTPITGSDGAGNRAALNAAVEVGADLVGGCPHLDPDGPELIRNALAVAADAGIGVDLHVDEMLDPSVLTLRELARQVVDSGFPHGVTASHCVSLGMQTADVQREVAKEVAAAGIAVVPLPQTNLFLQGRDHPTATPRGLTPVKVLHDAGVLVAAGADNVQDPFNLVGRSDPLETAALLVMAGHLPPDDAYRMVSGDVRAVLDLPSAEVAVGNAADLLAIDAPSIRGAIADAPMARRVYRSGRLVASADQTVKVHRG